MFLDPREIATGDATIMHNFRETRPGTAEIEAITLFGDQIKIAPISSCAGPVSLKSILESRENIPLSSGPNLYGPTPDVGSYSIAIT